MSYLVSFFFLCFPVLLALRLPRLGKRELILSAFHIFVRFVLVWICRFPLPLGVWERQRFVIVALPGLISYPFLFMQNVSLVLVLLKLSDSLIVLQWVHLRLLQADIDPVGFWPKFIFQWVRISPRFCGLLNAKTGLCWKTYVTLCFSDRAINPSIYWWFHQY